MKNKRKLIFKVYKRLLTTLDISVEKTAEKIRSNEGKVTSFAAEAV